MPLGCVCAGVCGRRLRKCAPAARTKQLRNILAVMLPPPSTAAMAASTEAASVESAAAAEAGVADAGESVIALHSRHASVLDTAKGAVTLGGSARKSAFGTTAFGPRNPSCAADPLVRRAILRSHEMPPLRRECRSRAIPPPPNGWLRRDSDTPRPCGARDYAPTRRPGPDGNRRIRSDGRNCRSQRVLRRTNWGPIPIQSRPTAPSRHRNRSPDRCRARTRNPTPMPG
jgi:hypothetical protein